MSKDKSLNFASLLLGDENLFNTTQNPAPIQNEYRQSLIEHSRVLLSHYGPRLEKQPINEKNHILKSDVTAFKSEQTQLIETKSRFELVDDIEIKNQIEADPYGSITHLRDNISAWCAFTLLNYCKDIENGNLPEPDSALQQKHYSDLKDLLIKTGEYSALDPAYVVPAQLHKGLATGVFSSFDILRCIPIAYYRSQNKIINIDQWNAIALNSYPLLVHMASMQLKPYVFMRDFSKVLNEKTIQMQNRFHFDFQDEIFYFCPESNQIRIEKNFLIKCRQIMEETLVQQDKRIGCPARQPAAGSKNSTIAILYKHQLSNLIKYLGPHIEKYTLLWASP